MISIGLKSPLYPTWGDFIQKSVKGTENYSVFIRVGLVEFWKGGLYKIHFSYVPREQYNGMRIFNSKLNRYHNE